MPTPAHLHQVLELGGGLGVGEVLLRNVEHRLAVHTIHRLRQVGHELVCLRRSASSVQCSAVQRAVRVILGEGHECAMQCEQRVARVMRVRRRVNVGYSVRYGVSERYRVNMRYNVSVRYSEHAVQ